MPANVSHLDVKIRKPIHDINIAKYIVKISKAVLHAITMDAEPIFKSKDWPYY